MSAAPDNDATSTLDAAQSATLAEPQNEASDLPMSADQLGIGRPLALLGAAPPSVERTPRRAQPSSGGPRKKLSDSALSERIEAHLSASLMKADAKLGLGPEGPVLSAWIREVTASALPARSRALLTVFTDDNGRVLRTEVQTVKNARSEWEKLAKQTTESLAKTPLRVSRAKPHRIVILVESKVQLPSGADPGLDLSLFGVQLKEGEGPKSTRLKLLSLLPEKESIEVIDEHGNVHTESRWAANVISLSGDLSDIGAAPRRVVTARMISLDIDEKVASPGEAQAPPSEPMSTTHGPATGTSPEP